MCRLPVLFIAFLASLSLHAQTAKWSPSIQENRKAEYMQILGSDENGNFYLLRSNLSLSSDKEKSGFKNRFYLLGFYSSDLKQVWEKELKTSYYDGHISDVVMFNGKVIVGGYTFNKKTKYYTFYLQFITPEGKWEGEPLKLDSVLNESIDRDIKPGFVISHDQSRISFTYRTISSGTQSYHTNVLDTLLNLQYTKQIEIPISTAQFVPLNLVLTDRGSLFILGLHYTTEKKVKEPGQSFFELYGYNAPLDGIVNRQIKDNEKFLTDVGISVDNLNRSIVIAGFYSDKSLYSTAGVFYYSLTEDSLSETRSVNTPFSQAYLQKFLNDPKGSRELVNFSIDRLFVRKDGGVGLIAESVYQTTRSYYDYYMQSFISHYYFHYGNIMVVSVNPKGDFLWNNIVSKDQNSVDDNGYYSSYYCAVTGGRLASVYNKYTEGNSSVLITFIDPTGAQKTDVLFNELEKVTIIPRSARQVDDETILMPAYKENKFHIVEITF